MDWTVLAIHAARTCLRRMTDPQRSGQFRALHAYHQLLGPRLRPGGLRGVAIAALISTGKGLVTLDALILRRFAGYDPEKIRRYQSRAPEEGSVREKLTAEW